MSLLKRRGEGQGGLNRSILQFCVKKCLVGPSLQRPTYSCRRCPSVQERNEMIQERDEKIARLEDRIAGE